MKQRSRYRNYLSLEVLVVVLVVAAFRVIPDKQMASVVTSLLFLGSSLGILFWEKRYEGYQRRPTYWGTLVFLFVSALPIFLLRLIYWNVPFDQIHFLGVPATQMHQASNYVFILMLVCIFIDSYTEQVKMRQQEFSQK
jgi:hypothetical protein